MPTRARGIPVTIAAPAWTLNELRDIVRSRVAQGWLTCDQAANQLGLRPRRPYGDGPAELLRFYRDCYHLELAEAGHPMRWQADHRGVWQGACERCSGTVAVSLCRASAPPRQRSRSGQQQPADRGRFGRIRFTDPRRIAADGRGNYTPCTAG